VNNIDIDISQGSKRVFVAGHLGMLGSALDRRLQKFGNVELIKAPRSELDLRNQESVVRFFKSERIDRVFLAAAKVGGIVANNSSPFEFLYDNLMIQCNVISSAFQAGVPKLLFFGSSCIYPRDCEQPITEESLLSGPLELTNENYALAKITGLKLCEGLNRQYGKSHGVDYRAVMPTNLYGPGDNYHKDHSHVIPGVLRKIHDAKTAGSKVVELWGTGSPKREFLYVDDCAEAAICVDSMDYDAFKALVPGRSMFINIGSGEEISISSLAEMIKQTVGYRGNVVFNPTYPDGTPRKLLNNSLMARTGWTPSVRLEDGLRMTYHAFLNEMGPRISDHLE
jgi:GDP-L-fucose synthase